MTDSGASSLSAKIKVVARADPKFDAIRLFRGRGPLTGSADTVTGEILGHLNAGRASATLVHGLRVQSMFGYVAAGLGNCRYVKEEDTGEFYYQGDDVLVPDYRVQTLSGWEALVEVKNHHSELGDPFSVTSDYLGKLRRYAGIMRLPLFFAVYWSQYRKWSLVSPDDFTAEGDRFQLSFFNSVKLSRMSELGDVMIATLPPLQLRFYADRTAPRTVGPNGETPFTIGAVELLSQDRVLEKEESRIAWFLIRYGSWQDETTTVDVVDGLLNSMTMSYNPPHRSPEQPFEIIGTLSSMISQQYNEATVANGEVHSLMPENKPGELGLIIPRDYASRTLPLWLLVQKPSLAALPPADTSSTGPDVPK